MSSSGTGSTRPMTLTGSVCARVARRARRAARRTAARGDEPRRSAPGSRVRDRRAASSGRHGVGDDRDDHAAAARRASARGASGPASAARERAVAQDGDGSDRRDAAHRRAEQRDASDAALPEPGEGARDVLDLEQPERRRSVVRLAVPAEVEAEDAGRPAQERAVLDEVRRDRARVAVEEQDRLVRIGRPSPRQPGVGRAASAPPGASRRVTGSRTTSPPSASSAGPSAASSGADARCIEQAVRGAPRRAARSASDRDRSDRRRRQGVRADHRPTRVVRRAISSASNTSRLHVSSCSAPAATSARRRERRRTACPSRERDSPAPRRSAR